MGRIGPPSLAKPKGAIITHRAAQRCSSSTGVALPCSCPYPLHRSQQACSAAGRMPLEPSEAPQALEPAGELASGCDAMQAPAPLPGADEGAEEPQRPSFDELPIELRLKCLAGCDWQTLSRAACVNRSVRALVSRDRRALRPAPGWSPPPPPARPGLRPRVPRFAPAPWPCRWPTWCARPTGGRMWRCSRRCCAPSLPRARSGKRRAPSGRCVQTEAGCCGGAHVLAAVLLPHAVVHTTAKLRAWLAACCHAGLATTSGVPAAALAPSVEPSAPAARLLTCPPPHPPAPAGRTDRKAVRPRQARHLLRVCLSQGVRAIHTEAPRHVACGTVHSAAARPRCLSVIHSSPAAPPLLSLWPLPHLLPQPPQPAIHAQGAAKQPGHLHGAGGAGHARCAGPRQRCVDLRWLGRDWTGGHLGTLGARTMCLAALLCLHMAQWEALRCRARLRQSSPAPQAHELVLSTCPP